MHEILPRIPVPDRSPAVRLRDDVDAAQSLTGELFQSAKGRLDGSRLLVIVTAAASSDRLIPYTVPLLMRQCEMAGLGVDVILGLNNGHECPDVLATYQVDPSVAVISLETRPKRSPSAAADVYSRGDTRPYTIPPTLTTHRIFAVHQQAGPWSAGKTQMLLDLFRGLLAPNLQRDWVAPRWSLLIDAETLLIEAEPDPHFSETAESAARLLAEHSGDVRSVAQRLLRDVVPDSQATPRFNIASPGLVRMLREFGSQPLDVLGAATHFCAFRHSTTFRGVPVYMPSPGDPISATHLFYNAACGLMPGCSCMPGGGTLAKTETLVGFMSVILERYPNIYGEDAIFTVLVEQSGLRMRLSRSVRITNRCPARGEMVGDPPRPAWQDQLQRWYRGFAQVQALYGRSACRSVIGPEQDDVLAGGLALAVGAFRRDGDRGKAFELLGHFQECGSDLRNVLARICTMEGPNG
jgi:hypothetical protein